ncbi:DNA-directed RNA polymerase I subunit RPA49 [Camelus ferus]|nr:DNA-directed RNA polymerase I subunit RPA49 [Camelus ferus]
MLSLRRRLGPTPPHVKSRWRRLETLGPEESAQRLPIPAPGSLLALCSAFRAAVQFSNGKLQNPGNMRFTLYKSNDSTNPRKKNQRILGVLATVTLTGAVVGAIGKTESFPKGWLAQISRQAVMDSCIEAFGTTKQKRALNSRRMNKVGSESLNRAVAKAAENIIDTKGVTALVSDAIHDDLQDDSLYLPPCHADATKPEDVYKFEDLLSLAEYDALQSPSEAFRNVTSEEILKMAEENSHCSFIIEALKSLPSNEERRDRQARCIWFLDTLIKFRAQKVIKRKSALGPGVPHVINTKLLKHFTCLTYNNGSLRNLISDSMKAKITAYVIILALHINSFQVDLTMLQRDLKLSEKRMMEIAKAMRLKISKKRVSLAADREEDHKLGTLSIPLPPAQTLDRQSKRRKIT